MEKKDLRLDFKEKPQDIQDIDGVILAELSTLTLDELKQSLAWLRALKCNRD